MCNIVTGKLCTLSLLKKLVHTPPTYSLPPHTQRHTHSLEEVVLNDVQHALVLTEDQCSVLADG